MNGRRLAERILAAGGRALVVGGSRSDRESLASGLSRELELALVAADVGFPLAGPPGAVSLARFSGADFRAERIEALCSLDAARFRLPLLVAVRKIAAALDDRVLLVEAPGVRRGMAGAELLSALVAELGIGLVVRQAQGQGQGQGEWGFDDELRAVGVDVVEVDAGGVEGDRARERTGAWDRFLEGAESWSVPRGEIPSVGAPPPREARDAWRGRQLALLDESGGTLAFGEIGDVDDRALHCRLRRLRPGAPRALLVRDARRDENLLLSTERRAAAPPAERSDLHARQAPSIESQTPPVTSLTTAKALLVNGIFGDPLLHVRLRHRKRSLLFDLGDAARLPARIVHQVSDVFISHAHFDHIGGFLWLLRSSIGAPRRRRLYGPPEIADRVEGMIGGILWDRIGDRGPVFEVVEAHGATLKRFVFQAGRKRRERLEDVAVDSDVLLDEPDFRVRAATLDHGVPVLAFAFEETRALRVRRDALAASGLAPGPWLSELKRVVLAGEEEALVALPDGSRRGASELASELLTARPGQKIVYATDLDDSAANRKALVALARDARVLYCEASFVEEDRHLARATQHLTARACGEIAAAARVSKLVPFHFSKRYEEEPGVVYREVRSFFPGAIAEAT